MFPLTTWDIPWAENKTEESWRPKALIILNQPFSVGLLRKLWPKCQVRCCADGGANRLHDSIGARSSTEVVDRVCPHDCSATSDETSCPYTPNFVKGDLDSLRPDVREYYSSRGVPIILDQDENSTDLMKCLHEIESIEERNNEKFDVILLGGLSGRLDQTVHTLSFLHKQRKKRPRMYAVTDENVGWVLDTGEHRIKLDFTEVGRTCGLLPVGISSTTLSLKGFVWNLEEQESSFEGVVSTSNAVIGDQVWIKTSAPIWWCIEMRTPGLS